MKKFILGGLAAAAVIAPLALAAGSAAAADVARCQATVVTSTATTATFDADQPAGAYDQWDNAGPTTTRSRSSRTARSPAPAS